MTTAYRLPDPFTPNAMVTAATPTCCCCCCCCCCAVSTLGTMVAVPAGLVGDLNLAERRQLELARPVAPKGSRERGLGVAGVTLIAGAVFATFFGVLLVGGAGYLSLVLGIGMAVAGLVGIGFVAHAMGSPYPALSSVRLAVGIVGFLAELFGLLFLFGAYALIISPVLALVVTPLLFLAYRRRWTAGR